MLLNYDWPHNRQYLDLRLTGHWGSDCGGGGGAYIFTVIIMSNWAKFKFGLSPIWTVALTKYWNSTLYMESQYSICPPPLTTTIRPRDHFCNVALSPVSFNKNWYYLQNNGKNLALCVTCLKLSFSSVWSFLCFVSWWNITGVIFLFLFWQYTPPTHHPPHVVMTYLVALFIISRCGSRKVGCIDVFWSQEIADHQLFSQIFC